jgi:hypothetical protein
VQQPNLYQPTYGELAFGSPGAPLASGYRIAPVSNRLQRNLYGGGYHEVGNYRAIDALPNPGYGPATGAQEDDILAQKMADLMQESIRPQAKNARTYLHASVPGVVLQRDPAAKSKASDGIYKVFRAG